MKAISGDVIEQLKARGIEVDTYVNDEVVKALLDAEFTHDYILKSIDDGDIKLKKQCEKSDDAEKDEEIEDKEVDEEKEKIEDKEGEEEDTEVEKGGDIEISETVKEKLRQRKGKKAEKDAEVDRMQKAMYNDFMKSQLTELLSGYGPVGAIWFDGVWDQDINPGFDWKLRGLYDHIHALQPL